MNSLPDDIRGVIGSYERDPRVIVERIRAGILPKTTCLYDVDYELYNEIKDLNIRGLNFSKQRLTQLPEPLPERL